MGRVIDWTLAAQVARGVARLQPAGDPAPFEALDGPAEESERLVSAYTGLVAAAPLPAAEAVGRDEWADANLALAARACSTRSPTASATARPARRHRRRRPRRAARPPRRARSPASSPGRVLGQYEFPVLDPAAPAAAAVRRAEPRPRRGALDAEPDQLLRWVALHETTHALQFGARAVAARAPRRRVRRAARRHVRRRRGSLLRIPDARRPARRSSTRVREGGHRDAGARPGAARAVRPHAGARWPCSRATPST